MLRRAVPFLPWVMILLSIIACEGGTSGSVVGSSQRCEWGGSGGICNGSFKKLSGTYGVDIEDDDIFSGDIIDVEAVVSVESGVVNVSVKSPDGRISSMQVLPNRPGTLVGQAEGDFSAFEVIFEAVDDEAQNIVWLISYQIR